MRQGNVLTHLAVHNLMTINGISAVSEKVSRFDANFLSTCLKTFEGCSMCTYTVASIWLGQFLTQYKYSW